MSQDIETQTGTAVETPPRTVDVAVIGAGYVGLPLAQTFAEAGRTALLVDVVPEVVEALNRGESHIKDVPTERLRAARRLRARSARPPTTRRSGARTRS